MSSYKKEVERTESLKTKTKSLFESIKNEIKKDDSSIEVNKISEVSDAITQIKKKRYKKGDVIRPNKMYSFFENERHWKGYFIDVFVDEPQYNTYFIDSQDLYKCDRKFNDIWKIQHNIDRPNALFVANGNIYVMNNKKITLFSSTGEKLWERDGSISSPFVQYGTQLWGRDGVFHLDTKELDKWRGNTTISDKDGSIYNLYSGKMIKYNNSKEKQWEIDINTEYFSDMLIAVNAEGIFLGTITDNITKYSFAGESLMSWECSDDIIRMVGRNHSLYVVGKKLLYRLTPGLNPSEYLYILEWYRDYLTDAFWITNDESYILLSTREIKDDPKTTAYGYSHRYYIADESN